MLFNLKAGVGRSTLQVMHMAKKCCFLTVLLLFLEYTFESA